MAEASKVVRALLVPVAVFGAAVLLLRGLDLVGRSLSEPPGGRRFASVVEVERRVGARLFLPAYFPQTLSWPPSSIRAAGLSPVAVLLSFSRAGGGPDELLMAQTVGGRGEIPPDLLEPIVALDTAEAEAGDGPARLDRLLAADGSTWYEVRFTRGASSLVLRGRGPAEVLLKMARSVHREGPR